MKRDDLRRAVGTALAQGAERRTARDQLRTLRTRLETLTSREGNVFTLVTVGLLNKQISSELGCSIRTVKVHRSRVMEKLQATSVADLVRGAEALRSLTIDSQPRPSSIRRKKEQPHGKLLS